MTHTLKEIGFLVEIYGHEEFSDGTVDKGTDGPKRAKERLLSAIRAVVEQRDRYKAALESFPCACEGDPADGSPSPDRICPRCAALSEPQEQKP